MTGAGRAAIAVVVVHGPDAQALVDANFNAASGRPLQQGQVRYGSWSGNNRRDSTVNTAGESVVVVPISGQRYEIHCHGGTAATQRIVEDLVAAGAQLSQRSEDQKNLAQERIDHHFDTSDPLIDAAVDVLCRCMTAQTASIAMAQVRGALADWRDRAQGQLERETSVSISRKIASEAAGILRSASFTTRLDRPWDVVLAGPPNVGKSSLINAIVGFDRSITMDLPGTTRDVLDAETVVDGWPLRLRDTAGMHETSETIEKMGIERAEEAVRNADLVVFVRQPGDSLDDSSSLIRRAMSPSTPVIEVLNKADLMVDGCEAEGATPSLNTVATTGEGVDALLAAVIDVLIGEVPQADAPAAINDQQARWLASLADSAEEPETMAGILNRRAEG